MSGSMMFAMLAAMLFSLVLKDCPYALLLLGFVFLIISIFTGG